jgi:fatty acid synthase subunit alpha, fungi type
VCSGRSAHVSALYGRLDKLRSQPNTPPQTRVPFSQRPPLLTLRYLRVSAPFHSPLLAASLPATDADCVRRGIAFDRCDLHVPVYATNDGHDLRTSAPSLPSESQQPSLAAELVALQAVQEMRWTVVVDPTSTRMAGVTHVLDFGPGGTNGACRLTAKLLHGSGIPVVVAGAHIAATAAAAAAAISSPDAVSDASFHLERPGIPDALPLYAEELLHTSTPPAAAARVLSAVPTWSRWGARVVRTAGQRVLLDTAYTRLTGRPPVLVGGMTPTTSLLGGS